MTEPCFQCGYIRCICEYIRPFRHRISELEAKLKIAEEALESIKCFQDRCFSYDCNIARTALAKLKSPSRTQGDV